MKSIDEILQMHKEILQESPEHEILPAVIGFKPDGTAIPKMLRPTTLDDPMKLLADTIHEVEDYGADRVYVVYTCWYKPEYPTSDYRHGDVALAPDKKEALFVEFYHLRKNEKNTVFTEIRRRGNEIEFGDVYRGVFKTRIIDDIVEQIRSKK